ncbi:hypothetical protein GCM10011574_58610 [Microbispora bryophytorum]|uniref:Uncharacterized protein n=1 Tax=Microbispora bryophytorum TaxID=1460882 RepID=A0A8H9LCN4_9ACTN|nr:hypothetical protein GCM10011574_58610 [Microbispora bryophytorum]
MCVLQQNLPDQDDRPAEPPATPDPLPQGIEDLRGLPHDPDPRGPVARRATGRDDSGATNRALS